MNPKVDNLAVLRDSASRPQEVMAALLWANPISNLSKVVMVAVSQLKGSGLSKAVAGTEDKVDIKAIRARCAQYLSPIS